MGKVVSRLILSHWRTLEQTTLLSMTNAGLFVKVVDSFLTELSEEDWEEAGDITFDSENSTPRPFESDVEEPKEEDDYITGETKHSSKHPYPKYLLKFHINSGSQAGRATFRKAFQQIRIL
jgi:hypothetical protein